MSSSIATALFFVAYFNGFLFLSSHEYPDSGLKFLLLDDYSFFFLSISFETILCNFYKFHNVLFPNVIFNNKISRLILEVSVVVILTPVDSIL